MYLQFPSSLTIHKIYDVCRFSAVTIHLWNSLLPTEILSAKLELQFHSSSVVWLRFHLSLGLIFESPINILHTYSSITKVILNSAYSKINYHVMSLSHFKRNHKYLLRPDSMSLWNEKNIGSKFLCVTVHSLVERFPHKDTHKIFRRPLPTCREDDKSALVSLQKSIGP